MLEGDWGKVASLRASANVVVVLDVLLDAAAQLGEVAKGVAVEVFVLEDRPEGLRARMVVLGASSAHGARDVVTDTECHDPMVALD